jgi:hypothetical protein
MKQIFTTLCFCLLAGAAISQSDKYIKIMEEKVAALDTTWSTDGLKDLANTFERIGNAEKNQWLPFYYAALANVNMGYRLSAGKADGSLATVIDPVADKAEALIIQANALSKDNSEIYVIKKMIASLRMMVDPMNRWMKYGQAGQEALSTAKKLDPDNPRVYILEAQDKFYTPEQFGGSKQESKKLFEESLKKDETFKPESSIHPHWGRSVSRHFLDQIEKS